MLPSWFNLAGCYSTPRKHREQSRQVRRRKFGIICPYWFMSDKTEDILCRIVVSVMHCTALRASPSSDREILDGFVLITAVAAQLRRSIEPVCLYKFAAVVCSLVFQQFLDLAKGNIGNSLCELMILHHPLGVQVFHRYLTVYTSDSSRNLVQIVTANVGDSGLSLSQSHGHLAVIV